MYDAIVVGARVAGAPTAMLLARRGHRVLLVDKAHFPSDTMSTHYLQTDGVRRLQRWGLLDRLVAAGTPPIDTLTVDFGPFSVPAPADPGGLPAYCPRRMVLDAILVEAAVEAGAELREGFSVQDLIVEDGTVRGVRGRSGDGSVVDERARIVVGADGKHSLVARMVGAETYNARPALGCGYYSYWSGISQEDGAGLYLREGNALFRFPTNAGQTCIAVEWRNERFHEIRTDIEGNFFAALEQAPVLAQRVRAGRREERFVGSGDLPNFFRRSHGPGWALVGDAGYHKDPVTGTGITDAFRDAELLVEAIDAGLAGRATPSGVPGAEPPPGGGWGTARVPHFEMEQALAGYEARRNETAFPMYEATCGIARFPAPGPELFQRFGALTQAPA